ncbi:MAG: flagellar biosynthesis protein FlhB [Eubacteriales bacterium]
MAGEKTEKATPKRRQDERKKGNVPQSKDIVNLVSVVVVFSVAKLLFPYIYVTQERFINLILSEMANIEEYSRAGFSDLIAQITMVIVIAAVPLLLLANAVSIIMTGAQTKFLFSMEALKPKLNKFNPINGFKRIFSIRSGVELLKNLIKLTIIIVILYKFIYARLVEFAKMLFLDLASSATYILNAVVLMVYSVCLIFVFVAGLDYIYQRWEYERKIKMSKQEIKEEFKQTEGDPQIKGKIKQKQRQMAMSRMMQQVPSADVVIKNPTHFAVALKYDTEKNAAPVVVAKGKDNVALRIIEVAGEAGVMVIEDRPLARAIYATTEIKMEIPAAYYSAIAEVFALVYNVNKKAKVKYRNLKR